MAFSSSSLRPTDGHRCFDHESLKSDRLELSLRVQVKRQHQFENLSFFLLLGLSCNTGDIFLFFCYCIIFNMAPVSVCVCGSMLHDVCPC